MTRIQLAFALEFIDEDELDDIAGGGCKRPKNRFERAPIFPIGAGEGGG